MYCKNCGKEIGDEARFCVYCGADQGEKGSGENQPAEMPSPPPGIAPAPSPEAGPKAPADKKKLALLIAGIAASVVIVVMGGLLISYFRSSLSEPVRESRQEEKDSRESKKEKEEAIKTEEDSEEERTEEEESSEIPQGSSLSAASPQETALQSEVRLLNENEFELPSIDYSSHPYPPADRDTSAAWDSTLFYTLEDVDKNNLSDGMINNYSVSKKELRNAETGNVMEFDIYSNPVTGIVNKIVSIEYDADQLLIKEYYYTDDGKVSFIYAYTDTNYFPSYAMPDRDGERFYFSNDCMVKWRVVENGVQTNLVVGKNAGRAGQNAGPVIDISTLNPQQLSEFDSREETMLNLAYLTLEGVKDARGIARIQGYVYDNNYNALPNAEVELIDAESGDSLYHTKSGGEGIYTFYVPTEAREYRLSFTGNGCSPVEMYGVYVDESSIGEYQASVYLIPDTVEADESILVDDALNYNQDGYGMQPIANADFVIRQGVYNKEGEKVSSGVTDGTGHIYVHLPAGMYTLEIRKNGYDTAWFILIVDGKTNTPQFHLSPVLPAGEVRIVLTWNASPQDLDSHLFTPYCTAEEHISYYHRFDGKGNMLDVDITTGYGPETVTIPSLENVGLYKYYVADFTNCSSGLFESQEMSYSDATVNVYTDRGLTASFHVPAGRPGVIWEVFEIRNGAILPSQRYYTAVADKDWWGAKW